MELRAKATETTEPAISAALIIGARTGVKPPGWNGSESNG